MKNLFGDKREPEQLAREAIRRKQWAKAIEFYEKRVQENEREFTTWNLLGDLHMNNRARAQAVEAWRRALEGFSLEGLYENVLGIAAKILRRTPEEDEVHLMRAEAYLGLEYYADCLAAFRSYLTLAKRRSEPDMRSLIRKILDSPVHHAHLLEELKAIFKESAIEDFELERRIDERLHAVQMASPSRPVAEVPDLSTEESRYAPEGLSAPVDAGAEGLIVLDGMESNGDDIMSEFSRYGTTPEFTASTTPSFNSSFESSAADSSDMPAGEGKDHYDLGMVYKEMKLWDAAIAEFEQARRDPSVKLRATLPLAECLQETRDLQGALDLLEAERQEGSGSLQDQLSVALQIGVIHELLGNLDDALAHFEKVREQNATFGDVESRIAEVRSRLDGGGTAY